MTRRIGYDRLLRVDSSINTTRMQIDLPFSRTDPSARIYVLSRKSQRGPLHGVQRPSWMPWYQYTGTDRSLLPNMVVEYRRKESDSTRRVFLEKSADMSAFIVLPDSDGEDERSE